MTIYCQLIKLIKCCFFLLPFWLVDGYQWDFSMVDWWIFLWDFVGDIFLWDYFVRFCWWNFAGEIFGEIFLGRFIGEIFLVRFRCHFHLMSKTDLIGILVWRPFFQVTHQEIEQALNMSNKGWSKIQHFSLKNEIVPFLRFQSKKIDIA